MALQEIRTFKDIQDAVIRRAKLNDVTSVRDDIKEKINTYYQHIAFKKAYRWSGVTRPLTLQQRESAGTIAVTKGSHVVTGTGTAFAELEHRFAKIKIGTQPSPFKIVRVASTTSITLEEAYPGTTASLLNYIIYKDEYGLFPDLMNIRKMMLPGFAFQEFLLPASPDDLDQLRNRTPFRTGIPKKYTCNSVGLYTRKTWADFLIGTDFWEDDFDDKPQRKNLIIWPAILTEDRIANIRYSRVVPPMGADSEEPLVPYENRKVLVSGPVADYYLQERDIQMYREWDKRNKQDLKEMESDIESTDDELIFRVDRTANRRRAQAIWNDDELLVD